LPAQYPAHAHAADQAQQAEEQQEILEHDPSFHRLKAGLRMASL